jgi:predicted RNA binding protein YcfA (HicA-like mRNA interferase family)
MRPISGKELCQRLKEAGWQLKRIKAVTTFSEKQASGRSSRFPYMETTPGLANRIAKDAKINW